MSDDDMDGIANAIDKCPDTPLTDIVDATGCTVEKVVYPREYHISIEAGYAYGRYDEERQRSHLLSLRFESDDLGAFIYTSDYSLSDGEDGMDDSVVGFFYRFSSRGWHYKTTLGAYLPTSDEDENEIDYFFSLRGTYVFNKMDFFADIRHTFVSDFGKQDTNRLLVGVGMAWNEVFYTSFSYSVQSAFYDNDSNLQSFSLFGSYAFDDRLSFYTDLSKGVDAFSKDYTLLMMIGYSF